MHARKCYTLNKQKVKLDFIIFIFCSAKERNSDKFEIIIIFFFRVNYPLLCEIKTYLTFFGSNLIKLLCEKNI